MDDIDCQKSISLKESSLDNLIVESDLNQMSKAGNCQIKMSSQITISDSNQEGQVEFTPELFTFEVSFEDIDVCL